MNKSELVADVAQRADLSKAMAQKVVDAFIDAVKTSLGARENVALVGFGTFSTVERKARIGRDPRTGQALKIGAAINPRFTAGKNLKEAVRLDKQAGQKARPRR